DTLGGIPFSTAIPKSNMALMVYNCVTYYLCYIATVHLSPRCHTREACPVLDTGAGIQRSGKGNWMPAGAGMTFGSTPQNHHGSARTGVATRFTNVGNGSAPFDQRTWMCYHQALPWQRVWAHIERAGRANADKE